MSATRWLRRIALGLVVVLVALAAVNAVLAAGRDHPVAGDRMSGEDLALVAEAIRLRGAQGDAVWPGFGAAELGLVVYNDRFEFLIGDLPAGWEWVPSSDLAYGRRPADDPQAFAVAAAGRWAGSLPTRERMGRDLLRGVRQQVPPLVAQLLPVWLLDISPDLWVAAMLHEQLHALQATQAPTRWQAALAAYEHERDYPYDDDVFAAGWTREGEALRDALAASSSEAACAAVVRFLDVRAGRRAGARLIPDLVAFEQDLEWLEGLAKYAEIRSYELAADEPGGTDRGYREGLPHWTGEFDRLGEGLAEADGDLRFYLSGMAQARILDGIDPGWASRRELGEVVLEEALAGACQP